MGLLSDFYLQHFFFLTVLSMDISRTGLVDILQQAGKQRHRFQHPVSGTGTSTYRRPDHRMNYYLQSSVL
jgi:hypothetical protein